MERVREIDTWISPRDICMLSRCRAWLRRRLAGSSGQGRVSLLKKALREARQLALKWCMEHNEGLGMHVLVSLNPGQLSLLLSLGACRNSTGGLLTTKEGVLVCQFDARQMENFHAKQAATRNALARYFACKSNCSDETSASSWREMEKTHAIQAAEHDALARYFACKSACSDKTAVWWSIEEPGKKTRPVLPPINIGKAIAEAPTAAFIGTARSELQQ